MFKSIFFLLSATLLLGCHTDYSTTDTEDAQELISKFPLNYYQEKYRPQFHFSPEKGWMDDPNGLVYHQGEYHMFYQYNPDTTVWGAMHWGHAISKDLVNWEHLPISLFPDSLGYMFSGSVVIDRLNTSGFGTIEQPAMVAIFTIGVEDNKKQYQKQGLAFSNDNGRTWEKYSNNPVLDEDWYAFRDPKVFWHDETERWIMCIVGSKSNENLITNHVSFYESENLKDWNYLSDFGYSHGQQGGMWECPDLIKMRIENTNEFKHVLIVNINKNGPNGGSGTQYFIGDFDGTTFRNYSDESKILWLDYGMDNYAGVSWSNIPENDGRKIILGWMNNWYYAKKLSTGKWKGAMTVPRELKLINTRIGLGIQSYPVVELSLLRYDATTLKKVLINGITDWSQYLRTKTPLLEMELLITKVSKSATWIIELGNEDGEKFSFGYDFQKANYFINRTDTTNKDLPKEFLKYQTAPRISRGDQQAMKILIDNSSVEIFGDLGEVVMTSNFFPEKKFTSMKFIAPEEAILVEGMFYRLKSIWQ